MDCRELRDRLTFGGKTEHRSLEEHLETCSACARYAARLDAARRTFRDHHGDVEPDPGFAGRVSARLRREPTEILGWAAMRLLPGTLALLLLLSWFVWTSAQNAGTLVAVESPTEDLLSWVLEQPESAP